MKFIIAILFICTVSVRALAMDRFAALSMLESGDNDNAVGAKGEVSRYQIQPRYWIEGNPHNARMALANAQAIMQVRSARFHNLFHRWPTDFEFYILWNAPADFFAGEKISATVRDRADRFTNLCAK